MSIILSDGVSVCPPMRACAIYSGMCVCVCVCVISQESESQAQEVVSALMSAADKHCTEWQQEEARPLPPAAVVATSAATGVCYVYTHTYVHTQTALPPAAVVAKSVHAHTHTHTHMHTYAHDALSLRRNGFVCVCLCHLLLWWPRVPLQVCVIHTRTHTHTHTRARACVSAQTYRPMQSAAWLTCGHTASRCVHV